MRNYMRTRCCHSKYAASSWCMTRIPFKKVSSHSDKQRLKSSQEHSYICNNMGLLSEFLLGFTFAFNATDLPSLQADENTVLSWLFLK